MHSVAKLVTRAFPVSGVLDSLKEVRKKKNSSAKCIAVFISVSPTSILQTEPKCQSDLRCLLRLHTVVNILKCCKVKKNQQIYILAL